MKAARGELRLGAYSRFQWRHPGPLCSYLLVPFYEMSGRRTAGLNAGALVINLLALAATMWLLAWRGGAPLAIAFGALATAYLWRVSAILVSSWNAHMAVLPALAALAAGAGVASGGVALLPLFALLASFAIQTHLAVLPAVAAAAMVAALSLGWSRPSGFARPAIAALVVTALLWLLPMVEQLSHPDGNLSRLVRFFLAAHPSQPFKTAAAAWADAITAVGRPDVVVPVGIPLVQPAFAWTRAIAALAVPALVAAAWWAQRNGRRFHAALSAICAMACVLALWSATRIPEDILDHEVFWMSAVGLLAATAIVANALTFLRNRHVAAAAAAVFLAGWTIAGFSELKAVTGRSHRITGGDETVRDGASEIRAGLARAGAKKPFIRIDQYVWGDAAGIVLQLRKAGVPLALEDDWAWMFDDALAARGDEDAEVSISGGPVHERNARRPGNVGLVLNDHIAIDLLKIAPSASSTR